VKVWVATINHRHGTNVYAARTERKLYAALVDFAMTWWDTEITSEERPILSDRRSHSNNRCVVDRYFELSTESLDVGETELL
jgi:hypothetical protein